MTIQAQIMDLLVELKDKINTAIILITHDLGVVAGIADRVAVMYAGKVVETGTTAQIFLRAQASLHGGKAPQPAFRRRGQARTADEHTGHAARPALPAERLRLLRRAAATACKSATRGAAAGV